jgi:hypothetical protein
MAFKEVITPGWAAMGRALDATISASAANTICRKAAAPFEVPACLTEKARHGGEHTPTPAVVRRDNPIVLSTPC